MQCFLKSLFALGAVTTLAGCEVQPSDPENTPGISIFEVRDGTTHLVHTSRRDQTPLRTACSDGSLPAEVAGEFDGPAAWNQYYVLQPGQTSVEFLMSVGSRSGVSTWIMSIAEPFDVVDPETPRLPSGFTVFGFDLGSRFFSTTIRSMTLELGEGQPVDARGSVSTIISTGGGRDLAPGDGRFTLIASC